MRVLLDESLPRQLRRVLPEHEVRTVPEVGWAGTKSSGLRLCIVILQARSNDIADLLPLAPELQAAVKGAEPGSVVRVGEPPGAGPAV